MDTENRSRCSVRNCSCSFLRMPRTTPRAALLGESVTQTTKAPLWSHLQLCSICRQYSLSSWTLIAGSRTAAPLKQGLQQSLTLDSIMYSEREPQAHPAFYLDKGFSLQIGLLYTPPLIFIKDFLSTLGQTIVFFCLLNLREVYFPELPLAPPSHPLPIQQLKSCHHGFVGQMETKSPQMYLSRVPLRHWHQTSLQSASLGKTLQSKKCPVALSHLKRCHSQKDKLKMLADSRQLG